MHELLIFAAVWFFATIPLGPNALLSMDIAVRFGWPKALMVPVGITAASLIYASLSIEVLAKLLELNPKIFYFCVVLGSLYLFYLAGKTALRQTKLQDLHTQDQGNLKLFILGLATSLSNPKAALMYLSILPGASQGGQISTAALIATTSVIVFAVYTGYSGLAHSVRGFFIQHPARLKVLGFVAAGSFITIASLNLRFAIPQLLH